VLTYLKSAVADERQRQRRAEDLTPGSRVQNRGGSDTPAPTAGTRSFLGLEASVGCEVVVGRGPDDECENQPCSCVLHGLKPVHVCSLMFESVTSVTTADVNRMIA